MTAREMLTRLFRGWRELLSALAIFGLAVAMVGIFGDPTS